MEKFAKADRPLLPPMDRGAVPAPHVVILGAGASIAAYLDWGKIGDPLPSMQNLVDVLDLKKDVLAAGYDPEKIGFEDLYDELASSGKHPALRHLIENRVYSYFSKLSLPDKPTIYDYLILSLREKDLIATFNWDPFLLQAYMRNEKVSKERRPQIAFLHGNVSVGVCDNDDVAGIVGRSCTVCRRPFSPSRLLYPVKAKDYASDKFINNEWNRLRQKLKYAYQLTIFGYSAPKTDVEARKLMLDDWKKNRMLEFAEVNIIDIRAHDELEKTWDEFLFSHHYGIQGGFFESYLSKHPRRTCDAFAAATLMCDPWRNNDFPKFNTLAELQAWVAPLVAEEKAYETSGGSLSSAP